MARFIELNMVLGSRHQPQASRQGNDDVYRDTDEPGEGVNTGASGPTDQAPGERTTPLYVNVDSIRSFYRRQTDRAQAEHTGTRIYFNDGGHIRVSDTIDAVLALIGGDQIGR